MRNQDGLKEELDRAKQIAEKWEKWQSVASWDAYKIRADRAKMMRAFDSEWKNKAERQLINEKSALTYLMENNVITTDQNIRLLEFVKEHHFDVIVDNGKELYAYLDSIREMKYEEMQEAIDDKYQRNVEQGR